MPKTGSYGSFKEWTALKIRRDVQQGRKQKTLDRSITIINSTLYFNNARMDYFGFLLKILEKNYQISYQLSLFSFLIKIR